MPTKIVFIRHGESLSNLIINNSDRKREGILRYDIPSLSDRDVPLTSEGIGQAQLAAQALLSLREFNLKAEPVACITASPLLRTVETATIIAAQLEHNTGRVVKVRTNKLLSKRDLGSFWNFTYEGVRVLHPEEWQIFEEKGELHYRPPGLNGSGRGESVVQVIARARKYLRSLTPANGSLDNRLFLRVTHSQFILALLHLTGGISRQDMLALYQEGAIPNCALLLLEYDGTSWLPRII